MAADGSPAGLGHNNPPVDPFQAYTDHLADLRLEAGNWLDGSPIETQAQADEVSRLMDEHRKTAKDADAARTLEKKPHLDASKAVDAKWKPLIDGANLVTDACKKTLGPWLQKLEAERQAAATAARIEAERIAAEAAAAVQAAHGTDLAAREEAEALVDAARDADRAAKRIEGDRPRAHGGARAASLRTYYEPVLDDGAVAARHYWTVNRDACEEFFLSLAKKDVLAGKRQIPGFTITEDQRVV